MAKANQDAYQAQHRRRLSWMPWLYFDAPAPIRAWAEPWQAQIHAALMAVEDVRIDPSAFISPEAQIFAEPGRTVVIGPRCAIAAGAFLHGPITLGERVSLNARVALDGGRAGITVGRGTRIATGTRIFAFDHGLDPTAEIMDQPVTSRGIHIGEDVWIGAGAGVTDEVSIGDHAVVGMGAVVTRNVADWAIVGGAPARVIGDRRDR